MNQKIIKILSSSVKSTSFSKFGSTILIEFSDTSKSGLDRSKKSEIKGNLRNLKRLVRKAKPDKINNTKISEIRQVKDDLENSAREII